MSVTLSWSSRIADGAEEDGVERTQSLERVGRHHAAVRDSEVRTPREVFPRRSETAARGCGVEHTNGGRNDFVADAVAGNHGDAEWFSYS